ncbi:hypothetical protein SAMN02787142_0638 [Burkholderia sp. WP9]|nr:hypothetical protein SAMN02787142_0638 [Burkholderia sp. WP9]
MGLQSCFPQCGAGGTLSTRNYSNTGSQGAERASRSHALLLALRARRVAKHAGVVDQIAGHVPFALVMCPVLL